MKKKHDGDCTVYACLHNNMPKSGICTCGYGLQLLRKGDDSELYSSELKEKLEAESVIKGDCAGLINKLKE